MTPQTEAEELNEWLSKERFFISSEMNLVRLENIITILEDQRIKRIILSRDPVERFISFCGHSTRDSLSKDQAGTGFWGFESIIKQPMSANSWMRSCLSRMQHILNDKDNSLKLKGIDGAWTMSVYSQWMLASFQSHFDYSKGKLTPYGTGSQREHIEHWRSHPNVQSQMERFLKQFYDAWGTTEEIPLFIKTLSKLGIFSTQRGEKHIKVKNSSKKTQAKKQELFEVRDELIAEYLAMLPEEFWFNDICSQLASQHWEFLSSRQSFQA